MAAVSDPASSHPHSLPHATSSSLKCSSSASPSSTFSSSPASTPSSSPAYVAPASRSRFSSSSAARPQALPSPFQPPSGPQTPSPKGDKDPPALKSDGAHHPSSSAPDLPSLLSTSTSHSGKFLVGDSASEGRRNPAADVMESSGITSGKSAGSTSGQFRLVSASTRGYGVPEGGGEQDSASLPFKGSSGEFPVDGSGRPSTGGGGMRRMAPSPLVLPHPNRAGSSSSAGASSSTTGMQTQHLFRLHQQGGAHPAASISGMSWLPVSKVSGASPLSAAGSPANLAAASPLPELPSSRSQALPGSGSAAVAAGTVGTAGTAPGAAGSAAGTPSSEGLPSGDGVLRLSPGSAVASPPPQEGPSPSSVHLSVLAPSSVRQAGSRGPQTAHRLPAPPGLSSGLSTQGPVRESSSYKLLSALPSAPSPSSLLPSASVALPLPAVPPAGSDQQVVNRRTDEGSVAPPVTSSVASRLRTPGSGGPGSSMAQPMMLPPPPLAASINPSALIALPKPTAIPSHATQLPPPPSLPSTSPSPLLQSWSSGPGEDPSRMSKLSGTVSAPGTVGGGASAPVSGGGGSGPLAPARTPSPEQSPRARERDGEAFADRLCPVRWTKGQELGRGSYGTVYEGLNIDDGSFFAVKEIMLEGNENVAKDLEQEVAMMRRLKHANIVQYLGTCQRDGALYIFLELVKMGSLHSILKKYNKFPESLIRSYTRQILNGLAYLHNQNTVHRDIKCANVLVDSRGQVKLADFGMAKTLDSSVMVQSTKGSPYWMAPEVLGATPGGYGLPADIWSLGCTVLEMADGRPPWSHLEGFAFVFRLRNKELPNIPENLSVEARDFILKCLSFEPQRRPTADELLRHPFVAGAGEDSSSSSSSGNQSRSSGGSSNGTAGGGGGSGTSGGSSSSSSTTSGIPTSGGSSSSSSSSSRKSEAAMGGAEPMVSTALVSGNRLLPVQGRSPNQGRNSPARAHWGQGGMPPLPYPAALAQQQQQQQQLLQHHSQQQHPPLQQQQHYPQPLLAGLGPSRFPFPRSPGPSSPGSAAPLPAEGGYLGPYLVDQTQAAHLVKPQQQTTPLQQQVYPVQGSNLAHLMPHGRVLEGGEQEAGPVGGMTFSSWYGHLPGSLGSSEPPRVATELGAQARRLSEPMDVWSNQKPIPLYRYSEPTATVYGMDSLPSPTQVYPEAGRAPWQNPSTHMSPLKQHPQPGTALTPVVEDCQWGFNPELRQNSLESAISTGNAGGSIASSDPGRLGHGAPRGPGAPVQGHVVSSTPQAPRGKSPFPRFQSVG